MGSSRHGETTVYIEQNKLFNELAAADRDTRMTGLFELNSALSRPFLTFDTVATPTQYTSKPRLLHGRGAIMRWKWRALLTVTVLILGAGCLLVYHGRATDSSVHDGEGRTDLSKSGHGLLHPDSQSLKFAYAREKNTLHRAKVKTKKAIGREDELNVLHTITTSQQHHPANRFMSVSNSSRLKFSSAQNVQYIREVLDNIDRCLEATNLKRLAPVARQNAARYIKEYRKVVPTKHRFLRNCSSHCWETDYSITRQQDRVYGYVGNVSLDVWVKNFRVQAMTALRQGFHDRFESRLVCLPKIFLAGFPKCGSSFLWCFLNRLIHQPVNVQAEKEPHFWIDAGAYKHFSEPAASDFIKYILNFANGISQVLKDNCVSSSISLIDGSPNLMFNWPRFNTKDDDLTNYCLIPSTLPHFLPAARFIVVMRNPIKMLYSAFWFSCTMYGIKLSPDIQLKGPSLFHNRIETKLSIFNDCMRTKDNPAISHLCVLNDSSYDSCISKRLHLLDECVHQISFNVFSDELPKCGRSRVAMGLYFAHIRKWLSIVPRDRFIFLTLEELVENPIRAATDISHFLGYEQSAEDIRSAASFASSCSENSQTSVNYKANPQLQMRIDTKNMLETFYRPFNALLANLLQDFKFLWT